MKKPPMSLQEQAAQELVPGFVGKRYALCSDGLSHLILAVLDNGTVDTQCCEDVQLAKPGMGELCRVCWDIQWGNK